MSQIMYKKEDSEKRYNSKIKNRKRPAQVITPTQGSTPTQEKSPIQEIQQIGEALVMENG